MGQTITLGPGRHPGWPAAPPEVQPRVATRAAPSLSRSCSGERSRSARRLLLTLAAALVTAGITAPSASAAYVTFAGNQGLSAGNIYAANTANAHTTDNVNGDVNHTWCPAASQGVRGYSSTWPYLHYGYCGPYYQYKNFCNCIYTRGTVYNPNQVTFDYIYYANWLY